MLKLQVQIYLVCDRCLRFPHCVTFLYEPFIAGVDKHKSFWWENRSTSGLRFWFAPSPYILFVSFRVHLGVYLWCWEDNLSTGISRKSEDFIDILLHSKCTLAKHSFVDSLVLSPKFSPRGRELGFPMVCRGVWLMQLFFLYATCSTMRWCWSEIPCWSWSSEQLACVSRSYRGFAVVSHHIFSAHYHLSSLCWWFDFREILGFTEPVSTTG